MAWFATNEECLPNNWSDEDVLRDHGRFGVATGTPRLEGTGFYPI